MMKLLLWIKNDWTKLITPGNEAGVEQVIAEKSIQRFGVVGVLLLVYEPISLLLMLTGHTQTYTLWYILPTVQLILLSAIMEGYIWIFSKDRKIKTAINDMVCCIFSTLLILSICALIIGDITQYGQTFLNYLIALGVVAMIPIQRFYRLFLFGLFPFFVQMIGLYVLVDHTIIIEPIFLFIAVLVLGCWNAHMMVASENRKIDIQHSEEELRVSEERYKLALEQSGKIFFFFDLPTRSIHISDGLARQFGLPMRVINMPNNLMVEKLIDPDSRANYHDFSQRILNGEKNGETIIACHTANAPEKQLWYSISFTSIFSEQGRPLTAAIICEDLTQMRLAEIETQWKQQKLLSVQEEEYGILEFNVTRNEIMRWTGGMFEKIQCVPQDAQQYDDWCDAMLSRYFSEQDRNSCQQFFSRQRLLARYGADIMDDSIEYQVMRSDDQLKWTETSVQMIRDSYSGDVLGQLFFRDIHSEKSGELKMQKSLKELEKELEQSRIKVMINQMQPHFLYNALSAIQTIVKIDPDYAYQLLYDFTVHLRSSIKALQSDAPIRFQDEMKNIKAYLNIEKMRFGKNFKIQYDIQCTDFVVIPLTIQPLAENAARHGIYPKGEEGGIITIRSYETENSYVVEVEDDGEGFDVDQVLNQKSDSVGLNNLIFRLKTLMNSDVHIQSKLGQGTKVTVLIPKEAEEE